MLQMPMRCAASTQLCAMHMRRSIGGMWTGWGLSQWTRPVPERPALVTPANNCPAFHARQCPVTRQCASGCARNEMRILARHISREGRRAGGLAAGWGLGNPALRESALGIGGL